MHDDATMGGARRRGRTRLLFEPDIACSEPSEPPSSTIERLQSWLSDTLSSVL
jgi:hypothetical protein